MRRVMATVIVLFGAREVAWAQYGVNCQAPCPSNCQVPQYCYPPTCVCPPKKEPEAAVVPTQPEGAFIAGPQRGEVAGESSSVGLRFGTLRIPELTIPFPTVQLPSLIRFRRDAEMVTESAHLPYVQSNVPEFALQPEREAARPTPEAAVTPTPPPSAPESAPAPIYPCYPPSYYNPCVPGIHCTQNGQDQRMELLAQQLAQLNAAVSQLAALQSGQMTSNASSPGRNDAHQSTIPHVSAEERIDTRSAQFEAQYQQKCQESEALRAQLAELQQSYQQMLDATQRQIVAQREDRLRQQIGQPEMTEPAATPAPRPMPTVARKIEPASYQETVAVPTLYRPSSSDEVFGKATDDLASQYQWRQPEPQSRQTATRTQTETRSASSQPAAQNQSRTVQPKAEGKLSKGVLSRWFGGRK